MSFNLLALALASIGAVLVGVVWYRPSIFGDRWQSLTGVDPNRPKRPALVFPLSFVLGAITAVGISATGSAAVALFDGGALPTTLVVTSILWLAFTAAPTGVHYLFEGRHPAIYAINTGHQLVAALVMAAIIGSFGY